MSSDNHEVVITRVFDAPRHLAFEAWSDTAHLSRWHAPAGCSLHFDRFEFCEGGFFISRLISPAGQGCLCRGTYIEIVVPERIVYTLSFSDEFGNIVEPIDAGKDADWPRETVVTVTFKEHGNGTALTLHQTVLESIARRTGAYPGWIEMLNHLEETLLPKNSTSGVMP